MKNIREWFPHAEVTDQANPPAGYVAIPLQAHQWLLLKEEELTEREKQLISWLGGEEEVAPNPWYQYLEREKPLKSSKKCSSSIATSRIQQRKGRLLG